VRSRFQSKIRFEDLRDLNNRSTDWTHALPLLGAVFCLLIFYAAIFLEAMLSFTPGRGLHDYACLYTSVYAWAHHLNPYLAYPLILHNSLGIRGLYMQAVNLNPPVSLYLFRPLLFADPYAGDQVWTVVLVLSFAVSLALIVRANPNPALRIRILMILGMAGVWFTFDMGQIYMFLLLLIVVSWLSFKKNNFLLAAVSIGLLCALKPNFLVWPVLLILARHRKAGVSAILTFATISAVPLVLGDGIQLYRLWYAACKSFRGISLPGNSSIVAMLSRLDPYTGITHYYRDAGYALTIFMLLAVAWIAFSKRPDIYRASEIALIISLLAGPVSWVGYTVVLIPMLYERQLSSVMRISWIILCIPSFALYWIALNSPLQFALLGSPYFYGIVLIGASLFYELYRNQEDRLVPSEAKVPVAGHSALLTEPVMEMSWK
jgi:alpha-1,2-mannosyltransferase